MENDTTGTVYGGRGEVCGTVYHALYFAVSSDMAQNSCVRLQITGRVQGVGFRFFVVKQASRYNVAGWVRNRPDGSVEVEAEAPRDRVEAFIEELRNGPSFGHVDYVDVDWREPRGSSSFEVIG